MDRLSRRRLLKVGAAAGALGSIPLGTAQEDDGSGDGHHDGGGHESWDSSPDLEKYVQALPRLETREPDRRFWGTTYLEIPVEEAQHSFHPDLDDTTIWGYDGQFPGPIVEAQQHLPTRLRFDNSGLPEDHLFEIDKEVVDGTTSENYHGYDGPVPDVRTVTHAHGLNAPTASDGQADMWTSPSGVTGPRFEQHVQRLPNRQSRLTSTYHDHARGVTRLNVYAGLVGPYHIRGWWERFMDLPEDEYDVSLVLADRAFHDDGSLYYPDDFVPNFGGDVATVNGAAWPYLEVEPRRYRFRILNPSNGRTYSLGLAGDGDGHDVPTIHQISPGHGFLEDVVAIGHGGDMETLTIASFERAEVIVDFSDYAGQTFTVINDAPFPFSGGSMGGGHDGGGHGGSTDGSSGDGGMDHDDGDHPQIHELMQIRVAESGGRRDRTTPPTELDLPGGRSLDTEDVAQTRQISMEMVMGSTPSLHTLNGKRWGDPIEIEPQLGSTEIWEVSNTSMHTHPLHLHLVDFEVLGRGPDGTEPPLPNERGGKDVVRVDPDETVRIAAEFGDYAGKFPFHCHVLEHEEHDMMRMFRVVEEEEDDHPWWHDDNRGRGNGRDNEVT